MDRVTGRLQPMGVAKSQTRLSNLAGSYLRVDFLGGSDGKKCACNAGDLGSILGWEDPLEKGKDTQSSILSWRIPWTIQFMKFSRPEYWGE